MKSNKWILIIGIFLGVVAVVLVNVSMRSQQEAVTVFRLKEAVKKGEKVKSRSLEEVLLPKTFKSITMFAVPRDDIDWVLNRPVNQDVSAGEFLKFEFFSRVPEDQIENMIGEKNRAISIPVDEVTSVGQLLEPGSHVDILGTFVSAEEGTTTGATGGSGGSGGVYSSREHRAKVATKTILQNIRVLAVGDNTKRSGLSGPLRKPHSYRTVTLEVTPEQAEKIVFALQHLQGKLTLTLRNPNDQEQKAIRAIDWTELDKS